MECFDNLVSVRDICPEITPKSEVYLDDIGVSKTDLEAFITSQYENIQDYFDSRFQFAVKSVTAEIYNHFNKKYLAGSLVSAHRLGYYDGNLTTVLGANYRGINMHFSQDHSFFNFTISEINLFLNYTGDVDVVIYDLDQNKLLHTITVPCVSGKISTYYIHKKFTSAMKPTNIFIGYNSTGITAIKTPIKANLCCGNIHCSNNFMQSKGVEISGAFVKGNITNLTHTAGISLVYDVSCDHENWICAHARSLSMPLAYKCAEIVTGDALNNSSGERATNHHTINVELLKDRNSFFARKYSEFMTNILSNMKLPNNRCFSCNTPSRHVIALP
jgi:hypothetical protein